MSEKCRRYVVMVGDKEVFLSPGVVEILQEYLHRPMSLEELAEKLGLETWEEAYEFIKRVPAWVMWTPMSLWRTRLKEEGCLSE